MPRDDGAYLDSPERPPGVAAGHFYSVHFRADQSRTKRGWEGFASHLLIVLWISLLEALDIDSVIYLPASVDFTGDHVGASVRVGDDATSRASRIVDHYHISRADRLS